MSERNNSTKSRASDVCTNYLTQADELRVYFDTLSGVGFSLAELETLEQAIASAKRRLQDQQTAYRPAHQIPAPAPRYSTGVYTRIPFQPLKRLIEATRA